MKTIEAYQCSDGKIFHCDKSALEHEDDLIGCELNELFKLMDLVDNIGHQSIYNATIKSLRNKKELLSIAKNIVSIINYSNN